jgi:hypothetical protein
MRDSNSTSTYQTSKSVTTQKLNQGKKSGNQIHQLAYQKHSCTAPTRETRKRRRDGNPSPPKSNSIQDSVGNEENGHRDPDLNKTMINVTKEPSDAHKKTLKEVVLEEISEKFLEKILDRY